MSRWSGPGKDALAADWRLTYDERVLPPRRRLRALKRIEADERHAATPYNRRRQWRLHGPGGIDG